MEKYGKLEEDAPPQYSDIAGGAPPPQYPPQQYPPQYPPAAAPVVAPGAPVYQAPPGGYVIQGNPNVQPVAGQPQVIYVQAPVIPDHEAPDHLVMAILVTICCCLPLGIVGILKSTECRNARMRGDRENAVRYGREAKKFSLIGLGCGIAMIVVIVAIYAVVLAMAMSQVHNLH
jgi:hypothetical protein